jgi:N-methylhydantoinase A/acetophenone carboxylase
MGYRIGIDTGGTFTDCVIASEEKSRSALVQGKSDTTHYDLTVGFLNSIEKAAQTMDKSVEEVLSETESIHYATTIGTNLLIERTGPRLGLITTRGFEDTIVIGRAHNWADGLRRDEIVRRMRAKRPEPLIPRDNIVGVMERIDCFGNVVMPLRREEVEEKVLFLVDKGVRGIIVCLEWSFVNPYHELEIKKIIREMFPDVFLGHIIVLLSSEVAPKICEYKRSITTILEGFLKLGVEDHFLSLMENIHERGFGGSLRVARNNGGVALLSRTRPSSLYQGGPVAALSAASYVSEVYNRKNLIMTDMGGTSFDYGLILEEQERVWEPNPVLDRWLIAFAVVKTISIGAGGGSIAEVDEFRNVRVGPKSAGSMPGPACYQRGGTLPTVTDADVVLGYIDPKDFLGGELKVSERAASRAIQKHIAGPLDVSVKEAALRIREIIDGRMGQEIFKETALQGIDPRSFAMVAGGGAGPVHCCRYAEYADIKKIIVPSISSVWGAFGCLTSNVLQTYEKSIRYVLYDGRRDTFTTAYDPFNEVVRELRSTAERDAQEEKLDLDKVILRLELDMTYAQQIYSTRITSPKLELEGEDDVKAIFNAFNDFYSTKYGKGAIFPQGGVQINGIILNMEYMLAMPVLPSYPGKDEDASPALIGKRNVMWDDPDGRETEIYDFDRLKPGNAIEGPGLVRYKYTVCAIRPGWRYVVDEYRNGILDAIS